MLIITFDLKDACSHKKIRLWQNFVEVFSNIFLSGVKTFVRKANDFES